MPRKAKATNRLTKAASKPVKANNPPAEDSDKEKALKRVGQRMLDTYGDVGNVVFQRDEDGHWQPTDDEYFVAAMKAYETTGIIPTGSSYRLIEQVSKCMPDKDMNRASELLQGFKPQNTMEGMLAANAIGLHELTQTCLSAVRKDGQSYERQKELINLSLKAANAFTNSVNAFQKLRNGGEQRVTVQHVSVNEGGQAVIGNVTKGEGGQQSNHA